jgi:predicted restriction endonuclease
MSTQIILPNEADFYRFMEIHGPGSIGGKRNYLTWLRYVANEYNPDFNTFNEHDLDNIYIQLKATQSTRERYSSNSATSDIKSALNKYMQFISSRVVPKNVLDDIDPFLISNDTVTRTEIETRLGQGSYRKKLIEIWGECAVTQLGRVDLLLASHIKPWRDSNDYERVDPFNGLLLNPQLDKLFDKGYITFTDEGEIVISDLMTSDELMAIGVKKTMRLYKVEPKTLIYLAYHRKNVFIQPSFF